MYTCTYECMYTCIHIMRLGENQIVYMYTNQRQFDKCIHVYTNTRILKYINTRTHFDRLKISAYNCNILYNI